jgi:hypothetical protein
VLQEFCVPPEDARCRLLTIAAPFELMKFELIYDGKLVSSGNKHGHVKEKWDVRKQIEPQLIELWKTHPALTGIGLIAQRGHLSPSGSGADLVRAVNTPSTIRVDAHEALANRLRDPLLVGGKQFLPLVRKNLDLACRLEITFLRKGEPGALILPGGDLDNRMKTLFDALSIPKEQDLLGNPDHEPFLCLLEDDSLIIGQHVETGRLLTTTDPSPSAVHLLIQVSVNVTRLGTSNIGFIGD